jgi:hypothetical protein
MSRVRVSSCTLHTRYTRRQLVTETERDALPNEKHDTTTTTRLVFLFSHLYVLLSTANTTRRPGPFPGGTCLRAAMLIGFTAAWNASQ